MTERRDSVNRDTVAMPRLLRIEEEGGAQKIQPRQLILPWVDEPHFAIVLPAVFTKEQCDALIAVSEKQGYEEALVNVGYGQQERIVDLRKSERCIIDSFAMADDLIKVLYPYLPKVFQGKGISCVNERMRFLKYHPGDYFRPHMDGCFTRDGQVSKITLQIYLNEGFQGGSTRFLSYDGREYVDVVPKIGDVLIFQHRLLHEGAQLIQGVKYTIRTDVMYAYDEANEYKPNKEK